MTEQQDDRVQPDAALTIGAFFIRNNLTAQHRSDCYRLVSQLYPRKQVRSVSCQGYCSLTVFVSDDVVLQFRPEAYRLDLAVTETASRTYPGFAPITKYATTCPSSGLLVYSMTRIPGTSLRDFRRSSPLASRNTENLAALCTSFAAFLAQSWHHTPHSSSTGPLGMVGLSIESRLKALRTMLPPRFRPLAKNLLTQLPRITALPWVFTHGDLMPGNFMLDSVTGRLLGLVDWAESEYLPFGVGLYGLEEILGELTTSGFVYHNDSGFLRRLFWNELEKHIPDLRGATKENVLMARDLGILLWYGIAFDDGAINRVVQEGRDLSEIQKLDAFLNLPQLAATVEASSISERVSKI